MFYVIALVAQVGNLGCCGGERDDVSVHPLNLTGSSIPDEAFVGELVNVMVISFLTLVCCFVLLLVSFASIQS